MPVPLKRLSDNGFINNTTHFNGSQTVKDIDKG